jgi:diguanylate cyclase (GGDEF)-like protein
MLDLDHFKQVNDDWGHEAGNRILQHCAGLMKKLLRRVDIPCRYGGEEFALIMPATPLPRAVNAAERVRQAIAGSVIPFEGQEIRVTVSMGADLCMPEDDLTVEALVERADGFLYQAKAEGRNRVCHGDFSRLQPKGQVSRDEKRELLE